MGIDYRLSTPYTAGMNEAFIALLNAKSIQHVTRVVDVDGYTTFCTLPVIRIWMNSTTAEFKLNGDRFAIEFDDVAAITTCANNSVWVRVRSQREEILLSW